MSDQTPTDFPLEAESIISTLTARCEALQTEIAEAREACPIVRRQDYFDASLLTAVNETVRQLFQMQSWRDEAHARCEALEQDRNDFRDEVHTLAKACTDTALERDALRVRCEALTAERDRLAVAICPSGSVVDVVGLEALAQAHRIDSEGVDEYLDTGDETNLSGAYHAGAQAIRSRCQHLEQAIRKVRAHTGYLPSADYLLLAGLLASIERIADAALASLLPTQEEPTQTDENRVSFAAGYSTLVDDHAALLKDMRELMSQAYLACGDMQDDIVERAVLRLGLDPFEISKIPEGEDRD